MRREGLAACVVTTGDPHNSEYTADHWQCRQWLSGFDGSAGTAVVTLTDAALWTDSRYFIAAAQQLEGTPFRLMKEKVEGTPTIAEWLGSLLADSGSKEVAIDGMANSAASVEQLRDELRRQGGLTLRTNFNVVARTWRDRPPMPHQPVELQPEELAGESALSKLKRIRQALRRQHADGMLMARLDDIAWALNMRGTDVHCCPVFMSFLLISTQKATLFIDSAKLTADVCKYLDSIGVGVREYGDVKSGLSAYGEYNLLADPDEVSASLMESIKCRVVRQPSPVPAMKAVKTAAEQDGFRRAMERDGVAMVRWLRWLDDNIDGQTEMSVADRLQELRACQPLFRGLSFDTIAGYGDHGAIVHYEATADTDKPLARRGLLLVDSGAQYQDGTTDITRTIALGTLTDEERRVYTLVLKGHLRLQALQFPDGASGTQLDAIAREPLWRNGLNYLHGTGHGVGSFLNVHEGPHQIRMEWRGAPLRSGMTVTDEPGIYLEGRFGVRIENTLLVTDGDETECGRFLRFEPLTLCPIDLRPVVVEMLTADEKAALNGYHRMVRQRLSPLLDDDCRRWLAEATREVG